MGERAGFWSNPDSEETIVNPIRLENVYVAALSRIDPAEDIAKSKQHTPIFQRNPIATKKDAIRDAAAALGALWMTKGTKPAGATTLSR
jgi:hypothetical protein